LQELGGDATAIGHEERALVAVGGGDRAPKLAASEAAVERWHRHR
jgi:hypothetical protein